MNPSLAKAAYFILIDANEKELENLSLSLIDYQWQRLLEKLEDTKFDNDVCSLKNAVSDFYKNKLDVDDIEAKTNLLIRQTSLRLLIKNCNKSKIEIFSNQSGDKGLTVKNTFQAIQLKIKRLNLASLVTLVVYIQDKHGVQSEEDFANAFIDAVKNIGTQSDDSESLTKSEIKQNQIIKTQSDGTYNPSQPPVPTKKSLVLVFGLDYFDAVDHINENKVIEIDDFDWLKKAEWFKFDHNYQQTIPNDPDGNVCILQINLDCDETDAVTSRIQLRRLLKKIQEQLVKSVQIKSKPGERFQLANFQGFLQ
jgi:hypothetical protein